MADGVVYLQGLHLVTMSTPNGQKVQIMLEELHDIYGTEWTHSLMYVLHSLGPLLSSQHQYIRTWLIFPPPLLQQQHHDQ